MKQFCLLILIALLPLTLFAQEESSYVWFLGGDLFGRVSTQATDQREQIPARDPLGNILTDGFGNIIFVPGPGVEERRTENTTLQFTPRLGRQLSERWLAGLQLPLSYVRTVDDQSRNRTMGLGFGVFARYLFNPQHRLRVFGEQTLGIESRRNDSWTNEEWEQISKTNLAYTSLSLGGQYAIGRRFRLISRIGLWSYMHGSTTTESESGDSQFSSFTFDLIPNRALGSFTVGVEYKL